jgi:putative ATPase
LKKLSQNDVKSIIVRAIQRETTSDYSDFVSSLLDQEMIEYLAQFADGDARTALNLLEIALSLSRREKITKDDIKKGLTRTLVYDRAGDTHFDTISFASQPLMWLSR